MKLKIILELLYKFKNEIKVFQIASQQSASDIFFYLALTFVISWKLLHFIFARPTLHHGDFFHCYVY